MKAYHEYETVIGLEIHAELNTNTKVFCSCPNRFGAKPNTLCCPVCLGLPGAMPSLNRRAVELTVMAGLALHCEISPISRMDRKQYFYPDLPKGYQISQAEYPICKNGYLDITVDGECRRIRIQRIHLEEDAGKLIHTETQTLVDYNRSGVPLIEIVSEADLRSGREAAEYMRELRAVLREAGISDCKMQEGSMRCDVNLSIRRRGETALGERTEIKNLNSFAFAEKAIAYESQRQIALLERGERVTRETRRFAVSSGTTEVMRQKESAQDYRFLPEPDIPPFSISRELVETLRKTLPESRENKRARLLKQYDLTEQETAILLSADGLSVYFENVVKETSYPKIALNLILTDLLRLQTGETFSSSVSEKSLAEIATMAGQGEINRTTAKQLLIRLANGENGSPREIAKRENLLQIQDEEIIRAWVSEVLNEEERAVRDYFGGKTNAIRALQGKLMAKSRGRANPELAERLLKDTLDGRRKETDKHV